MIENIKHNFTDKNTNTRHVVFGHSGRETKTRINVEKKPKPKQK